MLTNANVLHALIYRILAEQAITLLNQPETEHQDISATTYNPTSKSSAHACMCLLQCHGMGMPPAPQRMPPNNIHTTNIQPMSNYCIG